MKHRLFFRALTITFTLSVAACGGGDGSGGNSNSFFGNKSSSASSVAVDSFIPAVNNSAYKDVLVKCINAQNEADFCRLSILPYIGQTTAKPTKADILAHTIVSHEWMATRFSQLLDEMPEDMFLLFRGVTGIAIGADIRPSYYDPSTGAIYLDPQGLWLTTAERSVISTVPDFRSDFARDLSFSAPWRYVKNHDYAWGEFDSAASRKIGDILLPMADLLFHELAHANDFMPPALYSLVNSQNTPSKQADAFQNRFISNDLTARVPLNSAMLFGLGEVMFHGVKESDLQKQFSAEQVGLEFQVDGANDTYNYSSQYEDTAMLFEEVMMKYHFNVDREVAFTDAPFTAGAGCSAYVVRWGVRNRIGDEQVKSRAKIIVQQILGRNDASIYFANIPASRNLKIGMDWCENLTAFATPSSNKVEKMTQPKIRESDFKHPEHRL